MRRFIQTIFSVKRQNNHKVITLCGLKLKYKSKKKPDVIKQIADIYKLINDINYKQNLIMDFYIDVSSAKQATGALRQRQLNNVELLKEFKRICDKHNIEYWLDYGSLLGAQRHGGFVPWDDDLDVSMDKENLDKFKNIVDEEINPKYKFKFYITCYNRLLFSEDNGAFIDIYEYSSNNSRYRLNDDKPGFLSDIYSTPYNILFPLKSIKFEDTYVKCPNDIDTYLRIKYGNYELLPKFAHQVSGHNLIEEYLIFYPEEAEKWKI